MTWACERWLKAVKTAATRGRFTGSAAQAPERDMATAAQRNCRRVVESMCFAPRDPVAVRHSWRESCRGSDSVGSAGRGGRPRSPISRPDGRPGV